MGIYDREYYRDESGGSGWFSLAPACKTIIIVNLALFFAFWSGQESPVRAYLVASSSDIFRHGKLWELLTAAFIHDNRNILHVAWNMLFIWVVGREMEERYGSREFTFFYLTAAIFSTFLWAISDLAFGRGQGHVMFGASGAVLAVVTLYVTWYPRREMLLFFIVPVEAWMLLAIYMASDTFMMLQNAQGIGVGPAFATAFAAHLGGAAYGYLYKRYDLRWSLLFSARRRKPRLRVVSPPRDQSRDRPSPQPAASSRSAGASPSKGNSPTLFPEEQLSARLDEVLAKIAREGGRSGLTDEENTILQEASRRARDRRSDRT